MKRVLFLSILGVILFSTSALANGLSEAECDDYDGLIGKYKNECANHGHKSRNAVGVGADVILHEGKEGEIVQKVTGEYKYDWQNGNHSTYVVATTKLSDIWSKVKSIFKKGE